MAKTTSKKKRRGGRRPGAGRPHLFTGPRVKLSVKVTEQALTLVKRTREELEATHGFAATDGAAVEYLIRLGTGTQLDLPERQPVAAPDQENDPVDAPPTANLSAPH